MGARVGEGVKVIAGLLHKFDSTSNHPISCSRPAPFKSSIFTGP